MGSGDNAGLFDFGEQLADLPLRRAMHARVGDGPFPLEQELVLLFETGEGSSLEGIGLHIADAAFDLALVPRRARLGRQEHRPVVPRRS